MKAYGVVFFLFFASVLCGGAFARVAIAVVPWAEASYSRLRKNHAFALTIGPIGFVLGAAIPPIAVALGWSLGALLKIVGQLASVGLALTALVAAIGVWVWMTRVVNRRLSVGPLLYRPPGWLLREFAETVFSSRTFSLVLEPCLSDMQLEFFDALAAGRPAKARLARARGYCVFWTHVLAQLPVSLSRVVATLWKLI